MLPYASQQTSRLFDHLVGAGEQRRWHYEAEYLGRWVVDDEFELGRLCDRHLCRFGAPENATDIDTNLAIGIWKTGSVAYQAAGFGIFTRRIRRGQRVARRQESQLHSPTVEEGVAADEKRV